jgi:Contractile injection system tape measure protein
MLRQNVHIIQKQRYEIKTRKQRTALDIQNRLQDINTIYVLPGLAKKLDQHFSSEEVVTIDKLELELGKIKLDVTENEWLQRIIEKLDEKLSQGTITENKNEKKPRHQNLIESWTWFLKNGILPDESIFNSVNEIKQELQAVSKEEKEILKNFFLSDASDIEVERLVTNTDLEEKKIHLQLFLSAADIDLFCLKIEKEIAEVTAKTSSSVIADKFYSHLLWKSVFEKLIFTLKSGSPSVQSIFKKLEEMIGSMKLISNTSEKVNNILLKLSTATVKKGSDKEFADVTNKEVIPENGIYIPNAGLCLLGPWIHSFFKEIGLVSGNAFSDELGQQHAVYLLHYLVTNETESTEDLLVLPKLLCGWPLQMPVINAYQISEKEKSECEDLLRSLIQNWSVLKNTSTDGLKGSFLQREGKLTETEDQFIIQPEQQSIDMLLEYVPWAFRHIRLPWMKKAIQADWY